jgi:hypothetical protein
MNTSNRIKIVLTFAIVSTVVFVPAITSVNAATMYSSPTLPDVGSFDIASYSTPTGQDKWWPGLANDYGNPGKTVGQTFTTSGQVDQEVGIFFRHFSDFCVDRMHPPNAAHLDRMKRSS